MFSKTITSSARFLKMPQEAQNLYFHLCMNADDDGIVEAFTIMQMLGSSEDVIRILNVKNLVKVLNEDMVSYITDWNEHNLIRADRKVDSIYKGLLLQILPDAPVLDPKPRADTGVIPRQFTGRPLDGIGKDRLVEVRIGKDSTETSSDDIPVLIKSFEVLNPASKKFYGNKTQRKACRDLIDTYTLERVRSIIEKTLPKTNGIQFFPTITTPLQLMDKWVSLESAVRKYQSEKQNITSKNKVAF